MSECNMSIEAFLISNALNAINMLKNYANEHQTTVGEILGESYQQEIAHTVLTGGEYGAVLWSVGDIACLDANISQEKAREVLDLAIQHHDANEGLNHLVFANMIEAVNNGIL